MRYGTLRVGEDISVPLGGLDVGGTPCDIAYMLSRRV